MCNYIQTKQSGSYIRHLEESTTGLVDAMTFVNADVIAAGRFGVTAATRSAPPLRRTHTRSLLMHARTSIHSSAVILPKQL
jgi:hypothetical protein